MSRNSAVAFKNFKLMDEIIQATGGYEEFQAFLADSPTISTSDSTSQAAPTPLFGSVTSPVAQIAPAGTGTDRTTTKATSATSGTPLALSIESSSAVTSKKTAGKKVRTSQVYLSCAYY